MEVKQLSYFQKWWIRYLGRSIYAGLEQPKGFTRPAPFYFRYCGACREIIKTYYQGHGERLDCPNLAHHARMDKQKVYFLSH